MSSIEQRRIAELERAVANRDAMIRELKGMVATLIGRVEELEARLNQNSDNSDLPPSANPLNAPKSAKRHTGRKPGGQPGHRGHYRSVAVPDLVVEHHPIACTHCEASFTGSEQEVIDPLRHQITEIPPVQPFITEHRLHRLRCGRCRRVTRAPWPQGVPSGHFGHRIVALVAMLSGRYRITRREMAALLEDGFGVKLSVGTVQALCEQAARALKAPYEEVAAQVITEPTVHADETGWWHRGRRHWLWTVGTKRGVVFRLDKGRGHEARTKLLPDYYEGIVHTDRWSAYSRHERRQLCHAHLLRSWRAISESKKPDVAALGERGVSETERMLRLHREFREGSLTRGSLVREMRLVKARYARLLDAAKDCGDKKGARLGTDLNARWGYLWAFVHTDGVEPTNNEAERDLRPAALWRKGSFGTWSHGGKRFVERSLTVSATARKLGLHLFGFLVEACRALHHQQPAPTFYGATT